MSKSTAWCFSLLILILTACVPLPAVLTPAPLPTPTLDKMGSVFLAPLDCVTGLELDEQNVYWSGCGEKGIIGSVSKNGGETILLADEQLSPHAIVIDDENVFWLDGTPESTFAVMKVNKQGGEVLTLVQDNAEITSLAIDETAVYWTSCVRNGQASAGTVMKVPKASGVPTALFDGATCPSSIHVDEANVYWTDAGVWRMKKDGSAPTQIVTDAELRKGVSLRDDRSVVRAADIVKVEAGDIYYLLYVDNMPGMIACMDQHTLVMRMSKDETTRTSLGMIDGPAAQYVTDKDATYLSGPCTRMNEVIRIFDSGERAAISLEWLRESRPYNKFAVDENYFYWWDNQNNQLRRFSRQSKP